MIMNRIQVSLLHARSHFGDALTNCLGAELIKEIVLKALQSQIMFQVVIYIKNLPNRPEFIHTST